MSAVFKPLSFERSYSIDDRDFLIRPASQPELEYLRVWKNEHRQYFFYKEVITPEQQARWFAKFSSNTKEEIFVGFIRDKMNTESWLPFACVGYRQLSPQAVELFNLIRGVPDLAGQGIMHRFFMETTLGLKSRGFAAIVLKVLKNNEKAIKWYFKQGFKELTLTESKEIFATTEQDEAHLNLRFYLD